MNLIFRVIAVLWGYLLDHRRRDPLAPSVLEFRVLPNDLDPNRHMNNGRYLTIMDLGRLDLTLHTGLMREVIRHHWLPVLGGAMITYQRPIKPFQRYTLHTRLAGWDEKWLYMEQYFESDGKRMATAVVKGLIRGRDRSIPTTEVMGILGFHLPSPELPPHIRDWISADAGLREAPTHQN
jgi:acyl-CoA thioesterase FadM